MPDRRMLVAVAAAALTVGCATTPAKKKLRVQPTPAACQAPVAEAEALGRAMYQQDAASAWGTDVLLRDHGRDPAVRGWVTVPEGAGFAVHFFGLEEDRPVARYLVRFDRPGPEAGRLEPVDPPRPLSGELAAMVRARQSALVEKWEPRCSATYNTVVLPASMRGEEGWLVYLLAATTKPDELVVGGHHRRTVSADGSRVTKAEPLSKGCFTLPPGKKDTAAVFVTHLLSACPSETHVYLSLQHQARPLYVVTSAGAWRAERGRVAFLGPL